MSITDINGKPGKKNALIFIVLWLLTFVLYFPAAKAGWVIDAAGFLYNMKHQGFRDFINRTNSSDQSFYQVLTFHYYLFYKIWGFNVWLWGVLYITLHALNAYLVFIISRNLLSDSGIQKSVLISLAGVVLFTISPHISEVLIGRAYYHYLQSFFFILMILYWLQKYQHNQRISYILGSAILFVLSAFTLEIFYLLPFLVLSLAIYYRYYLGYDKEVFRKTLVCFFIPQIVLLGAYFIALFTVFKHFQPHKIELDQGITDYLSKLPKYMFHILFLGRYFSMGVKEKVYAVCQSVWMLLIIYSLLVFAFVYSINRYKDLKSDSKSIFLFFAWSMIFIAFLLPLSFPGPELLVFYDRYTYFADAFIYILVVLVVSRFIKNKYLLIGLFCICVDFNLFFTIKVNTYWMDSDVINTKLLRNFPNDESKTVLLLNIPENMDGVPMIGAQPEGMFKMMREIYTGKLGKNTIYDVASYNMMADYNGAHVKIINDSEVQVILNHPGTWWWYEGHGAKSYETPDYKVNMKDLGNMYVLTLKHPVDQYLLLYSVGDTWKKVDVSKKNVQQD